MAVVEYMFNLSEDGKKIVPPYIKDVGHWHNSSDETYIGWVDDSRDYWVPDTIDSLTKTEFINRQLDIHTNVAQYLNEDDPDVEPTAMSNAEVTTYFGTWYDDFVTKNS